MASLSAIVPVYNEEKLLKQSIDRLLEVKEISKIFVVDDNSNDNSFEIMKNIQQSNKKIVVQKLDKNIGKGGAIKSVFKQLDTDYVIIHDADLEYNPIDIRKMYYELQKSDAICFVIGSRFKNSEKVQKYYRTFYANKFLSLLFSRLYKSKITDIATCYKLMPVSYLQKTYFEEDGFAIEIELIAKYLKHNSKIIEVPISYTARTYEEGKKIKFLDGLRYLFAMQRYKNK